MSDTIPITHPTPVSDDDGEYVFNEADLEAYFASEEDPAPENLAGADDADTEPVLPVDGPPVEGAGEGGGEAPGEVLAPAPAAADSTPSVDAPAEEPLAASAAPATFTLGGREYPTAQLEELVAWTQTLTAEQLARLEQPAEAPTPPPVDPRLTAPEDGYVDPALAAATDARFEAQAQQIDYLVRQQEQSAAALAQQEQKEIVAGLAEARSAATENFGLDDAGMAALVTATENSNRIAFLAQKNPEMGYADLFSAAFEEQFWATPALRENAILQRAEAITAPTATQNAAIASRAAASSALVGNGAATPRQTVKVPATQAERDQAMIAEIAADMAADTPA